MIKTFKHKGLENFFRTGNSKGIQAKHKTKLQEQLSTLNEAISLSDLSRPSYYLHQLQGVRKETWSIRVSGNWRLTFRFENGNVHILNYEDYH